MATRRWLGGATAVAQVDTLTVGGTIEADDVFKVTLTAESGDTQTISVTAGSTTASTVAATIQAALEASTLSLFTPITWTVDSAVITATAATAGVPFYCTVETTEAGGGAADDQTFVRAAGTANAGPYDWNTADNWTDETVPVNSDDVYVDGGTYDILYGLDQSAVTLDELHVSQLYTGKIGMSDAYLQIGAATAVLGEYFGSGSPQGSGRIKIDFASSDVDVTVWNSKSTAEESNQKPVRLKINHASATLTVMRGKVGLCVGTGESGQVSSLTVGYVTNPAQDADVEIGTGVTIGTISQYGGKLTTLSGATTVTVNDGTLRTEGTGAITTLNVKGGTATLNSSGTITTLNLYGGTADFTANPTARTVTTPNIWGGATLNYDTAVVTMTADPAPQEAMRIATTKLYG